LGIIFMQMKTRGRFCGGNGNLIKVLRFSPYPPLLLQLKCMALVGNIL
jgi:hypothetical protein